jgi:putative ABC transport system substrate-binding protein
VVDREAVKAGAPPRDFTRLRKRPSICEGAAAIDRRAFVAVLAAGALGLCRATRAQNAGKVYRIGILEAVPVDQNMANLNALRGALRDLGYVEGRNLMIEYRSSDGYAERFPKLASELIGLKVDLIVTRGTPAASAARNATRSVPIVMATMGDPRGIVASFARPGGNVTGFTTFSTELTAKRLELLKALAPALARVGLLHNMGNPAAPPEWSETKSAARALDVQAELLDVRTEADVRAAFEHAVRQRIDALVVGADGLTQRNKQVIVRLAADHRLPAAYPAREFVESGGLMAYAISYPDLYARLGRYVDKILKGTSPGDLPVEQPSKFELVINLGTAKALGLVVPQAVRVRADELIDS